MKIMVTDIIYDLSIDDDIFDIQDNGDDEEDISAESLGLSDTLTFTVPDDHYDDEDVADMISDETGWCVHGFTWKEVKNED
jgi:hypothetical protein